MKKIYHLAVVEKNPSTVILQARETADELAPDAIEYFGRRIITKRHLRANRDAILSLVNRKTDAAYTRLLVD
jgi:hypothetical protein